MSDAWIPVYSLLAPSGWEMVTGILVDSRGLSPVSRLWDEQLEFRSSPASSTPSLHSCSLRETSASGKLETAVANHLQSKPSRECLVCRVCGEVWVWQGNP